MAGIARLDRLLKHMEPTLLNGEYVFCTFESANYGDHAELRPLASFREREGLTLIIPRCEADDFGLSYDIAFRAITLDVHSSLEAVGFTAAVAAALTERGISANVVAAYFHDHVFVQCDRASEAMDVLRELASR